MRHALAVRLALAVLVAAAAGRAPAAAASATDGMHDPACGTQTVLTVPGQYRYLLGHTFARSGSDSVWTRHATWVRGTDYTFDPLRGELHLLTDVAPGETLWVAACWLLAPPPLEYAPQSWRAAPDPSIGAPAADTSAGRAIARPATGHDIAQVPGGASLAVTGSKTVAVEFGSSQDAALRQSLDLAVSGQLAPGVELTGVLSDRNTPLTAAGSTQDLQSLDRVLIELKSPHASAALGDIPLSIQSGAFARLDRRVQGVRGDFRGDGFEGMVAAASSQGEYRRMEFQGTDGLQGPYLLSDADGNTGIALVAGSEIVSVDGQRMTRGESADYAMDYEQGRITFTNRRPISSSSRITIEFQYALTRYRRNIAAFTGGWTSSHARMFAAAISETDDRGSPLTLTLDANDRLALAAAGDSASKAVGIAVVGGGGDYDTVRVSADTLVYAWAGADSGQFSVSFARVPAGQGSYADSAIVSGRTAYRWVGYGLGSFVVGRPLPMPQSHQLVSMGGSVTQGAFTLEGEGAVSHLDQNTFSTLDDGHNDGGAGRLALRVEGAAPLLPGRAGAQLGAREVGRDFQPFAQLETPFAEQDWGLPVGSDLQHQRRGDAGVWWAPRAGSQLSLDYSRLTTPDGYSGSRQQGEWKGAGAFATHALGVWSDGDLSGRRFTAAGRRHAILEASRPLGWVVPSVRFEHDDRRTPSDSAASRDRVDELAGDLASGRGTRWKLSTGFTLREDRHDDSTSTHELRTTTVRLGGDSPQGAPLVASVSAQRRTARDPLAGQSTQSDLASVKLRGERRRWGLSGQLDVEVTGEAQNEQVRSIVFVGSGRGAYDALGNYVGTGDYDLVQAVSPVLDRYTRVATSARTSWQFGSSDAWKGSRVDFTLEDEARRRGNLRLADTFLSTGLALVDPALALGSILQRIESELAPGSHAAALRLRIERRVSADRSNITFTQTLDQRTGTVRWRARPSASLTLESEGRTNWQNASQALGMNRYDRTLLENGDQTQLVWQHGAKLRVSGVMDVGFSKPEGQELFTRTVTAGPEVGLAVGPRGRADFSLRRAWISGPPAAALLPSADPAGAPRWDGSARFDLRLHETTTFGLSASVRERPGFATSVTGRAEVRAFF